MLVIIYILKKFKKNVLYNRDFLLLDCFVFVYFSKGVWLRKMENMAYHKLTQL